MVMDKEILIIGAGKIGRGFIGQLFFRSGYKLWFIDTAEELVASLVSERKYRIDLARIPTDKTEYIQLEGAFTPGDKNRIADLFNRIEIMALSVGARNLEATSTFVREMLAYRDLRKSLNCLICENAVDPAQTVMRILKEGASAEMQVFLDEKFGLIETQVIRTGMPAKPEILNKEPLALRMQDWWTLPLDRDAYKGKIPDVLGFRPRSNFRHEPIRKLYTFNGTNGPIAYVGWVNRFRYMHESALALRPFFEEIQEESAWGLIHEYGFDETEHREYMSLAMDKYTDPAMRDSIERNARDLHRKLGKDERLLGPALLCQKHGKKPIAYARAIAAAYCYDGSDDEGTLRVRNTVENEGIKAAIQQYSGIHESDTLFAMVVKAFNDRSYIID
jgi:mannitol-1-phosphate 5-dehydrogenase